MRQYLDACRYIMEAGTLKQGRNGWYKGTQGMMMKFNLADGFPLVTTKEVNFKAIVAELFAFIRGANSAKMFRHYGTKIWDQNANKNKQWLNNPNREGEDDLGRIYGVQWRSWRQHNPKYGANCAAMLFAGEAEFIEIDQLAQVIEHLKQHQDNRREIVLAWNPGELDQMALPPCHMLFQFGIDTITYPPDTWKVPDKILNMGMYQRSCDFPLGVPFNIASYALLLMIVAKICDLTPGVFTHFLWDCHIYENQLKLMDEQLRREPRQLPYVLLPDRINDIDEIGTLIMPEDIKLENYHPHPTINYPFSV